MIQPKEQTAPADIYDQFQAQQNKNEIAEVLKELFDENKIYLIGDLSKDEIKLITRIYMIAKMKDIKIWFTGLEFFCKLLLSKNRKSRRELIDAIKGYSNPNAMLSKPVGFGFGRR